jgi:hypothetical protein
MNSFYLLLNVFDQKGIREYSCFNIIKIQKVIIVYLIFIGIRIGSMVMEAFSLNERQSIYFKKIK